MNPTTLPPTRGLFHDLLLPHTEHPFAEFEFDFESENTADAENDFLVQNRRPDLVSLKTPDQALWALDLP